jgi:hypothetical protein
MRISCMAAVLAAGVSSAAANAQLTAFNFVVSPQQEVPPNGSNIAGSGQLLYNTGAHTFDIDVQMFGLTLAELTGWHIHNAPAGVNGPIVIHLQNLGGTWQTSGQGIRLQMANVSIGSFEPQLLAGNLYFNVHNQAFPGGVARGQIIPAPAGAALLAVAGLVAGGRRRR